MLVFVVFRKDLLLYLSNYIKVEYGHNELQDALGKLLYALYAPGSSESVAVASMSA